MTLLGPGVTDAMMAKMTNETKSSSSITGSGFIASHGRPSMRVFEVSLQNLWARVKPISVDEGVHWDLAL